MTGCDKFHPECFKSGSAFLIITYLVYLKAKELLVSNHPDQRFAKHILLNYVA